MAQLSGFARSCLDRQGFTHLDDGVKARLDLPLRFTPTFCFGLTAVGVALQSPVILGLVSASALAAAVGVPHIFDLLFNRAVAPLMGGPRLPANPPPRRFAFVLATPVLVAATIAFAVGATAVGLGCGLFQLAGCLVYITTGWCPGSFIHELLFGPIPSTVGVAEVARSRG